MAPQRWWSPCFFAFFALIFVANTAQAKVYKESYLPQDFLVKNRFLGSEQLGFSEDIQGIGGTRVIVGKEAIEYAAKSMVPEVCSRITETTIPDQYPSTSVVNVYITGIHILSANILYPNITLQPPNSILFDLAGLQITGQMHFKIREKMWPHVESSGSADFSFSGSSVSAQVAFDLKNYKPNATALGVQVILHNLKVNVHGSALSKLYNLIIRVFKGPIRNILDNTISDAVENVVNVRVNQEIANFSTVIPLTFPSDDPMMFDARALSLKITNTGIYATVRGSLNSSSSSPNPVTYPYPLPTLDLPDISKMQSVTLQISEYTLNSALYIMFRQGRLEMEVPTFSLSETELLKFHLTQEELQPRLNMTQEDSDKDLEAYNGLSFIQIHVKAYGAPDVDFDNDDVSVHVPVDIEVFLSLPWKHNFSAFNVATNVSAVSKVWIEPNVTDPTAQVAHAKVLSVSTTKAVVVKSNIGPVCVFLIDFALKKGIEYGLPLVNKKIGKGMGIPKTKQVRMVNTTIEAEDFAMNVYTDVVFS